jgi:putative flippase GtrA
MKATLSVSKQGRAWTAIIAQFARFSLVGGSNTLVDLLAFNLLLWLMPTQDAMILTVFNSLAYLVGAVNSFCWNRRWTFESRSQVTREQLLRFTMVTGVGIFCNDVFLGIASSLLSGMRLEGIVWANIAKVIAIACSFLVSYIGMRFMVFTRSERDRTSAAVPVQPHLFMQPRSLSVVLPAYNEEEVIEETLAMIGSALDGWKCDFELIVVNDGSKDATGSIVERRALSDPRIRLISHPVNRGYGAALVTGFESATKETVFFMDADGQFDIQDLVRFFPLIEEYDAVLGYRIERQDSWMRKLNARGWKMLVRFVFGVRARDIDCAFKLYRADFFREQRLETRGAMINAEILYKLARSGRTTVEVGVRHLPRRGGQATGAKLSVIVRAIGELFVYARKWYEVESIENAA